jgi:hypothetical protein
MGDPTDKAHRHRPLSETERARNRMKSQVRAKVEHVFLVIKRIFRVDQSPVPRAGEDHPLAIHQLRLGESVCGSPAPASGDRGRWGNGVVGGRTAGEPR